MSDEFGVVISAPDLPGFQHVPGSERHKCTFCDRHVRVSPSTSYLLSEDVLPACPVCVMARSTPDEDEYVVTDKVREDILARTGETPEEILGSMDIDASMADAVTRLAERTIKIEGEIERGERG